MLQTQEEKIIRSIDSSFVLNEILQKINSQRNQIDLQTNTLVVLSAAVFVFSAQRYLSDMPSVHIYLLCLSLFSAVAAVVGLFSINPPSFMRKKGQQESLFYYRRIAKFESQVLYEQSLKELLGDEQKIVKEYALEIFNLSKYSFLPRRYLFKMARNIFVVGFTLSLVLFIFGF